MTKTRNILASFRTVDEAQRAGQELKALGIKEMQIDRVSLYPGFNLNEFSNPITGRFDSLADLTLGSDFSNKSAEILAAADVNASGLSDGGEMDIDRNVLLTIVADENLADQAEQIIQKYNGMF
ncbi:hypothetical protein [Tepidibacillus fermentans]|uniref:Heat induced stress protein YflT n=1 Tax=Tepidibacillus fermentans TaxID=1281767 RepID=A0A4R3KCG1_9BACI|nr:hypothetical protein [Tepidibacillus fermentans]TCS80788.1 hypothetical protein EDD72_11513 [Tepidibacillus fermentans]